MLLSASEHMRALWGWSPAEAAEALVALFSVRLDETGTDGRSPFTVVGGAVAPPDAWDELEFA